MSTELDSFGATVTPHNPLNPHYKETKHMNKNTITEKELDQMEPWEEEYKEYLDSLEDEDDEDEEDGELTEDDYLFQEDL